MNMGRNLYGIDVPRNIDFIFDEDMHKLTIHINYPEKFMYKDDAAFEAWALFFYEKKKFDVELSFNNIAWDGDFNNILPEQSHYMRFLYRAWKFSELLPWFKIGEDNKKI